MPVRTRPLAFVLLALTLLAGCAARDAAYEVAGPPTPSACRTAVTPAGVPAGEAIEWRAPPMRHDRERLDAWCETIGPPLIGHRSDGPAAARLDDVVIVSWNVHVGAGDVPGLVERLRAGAFTAGRPVAHFVLLLQEAYREGAAVPHGVPSGARTPQAIRVAPPARAREDVARLAQGLGLALYYVPSMRNGAPGVTSEDRGNAVLSTLPLSDFEAIELPFERQRRVAIAATAKGVAPDGEVWALRVASAHLDNLASARRLWLAASGPRVRQARGLLATVGEGATVLGGDFNTWFGFGDPAYREIATRLTDVAAGDRRPTFAGLLRLDHLFARLPRGWTARGVRLDDRFGSDHYPLLARIYPSGP